MVKVKICGITNRDDAVMSVEAGADLLGFVFVPGTPRCVGIDIVREITADLPAGAAGRVGAVGLFRDERTEAMERVISECGLGLVQLHGDESPETCAALKRKFPGIALIKTFKFRKGIMPCGVFGPADYPEADMFLFDTYHPSIAGGTGRAFDWPALKKQKGTVDKPFLVAGGLDAMNVSEAVKALRPYGVDVSSGVERSPGKKDPVLVKEFIENAKKDQIAG